MLHVDTSIRVGASSCILKNKMMARLTKWITVLSGKEIVGRDSAGNIYFRKPHTRDDGSLTEKRWVEFAGDPEPTSLPVEWTSWLSGTRTDAPTPEEIQELQAQRKLVKLKVQLLQQEEEKRKFRAKSLKQESGVDMSPQTMERFLRQVSEQDAKSATAKASDEDDSSRSTEPSGTGDSFVPGKWRP